MSSTLPAGDRPPPVRRADGLCRRPRAGPRERRALTPTHGCLVQLRGGQRIRWTGSFDRPRLAGSAPHEFDAFGRPAPPPSHVRDRRRRPPTAARASPTRTRPQRQLDASRGRSSTTRRPGADLDLQPRQQLSPDFSSTDDDSYLRHGAPHCNVPGPRIPRVSTTVTRARISPDAPAAAAGGGGAPAAPATRSVRDRRHLHRSCSPPRPTSAAAPPRHHDPPGAWRGRCADRAQGASTTGRRGPSRATPPSAAPPCSTDQSMFESR